MNSIEKNSVKCPYCGTDINVEKILEEQIQKEVAQKYTHQIISIKEKLEKEKLAEIEKQRLQIQQEEQSKYNASKHILLREKEEKEKEVAELKQKTSELLKIEADLYRTKKEKEELEISKQRDIENAKYEAASLERQKAASDYEQRRQMAEERWKIQMAEEVQKKVAFESEKMEYQIKKEVDRIATEKEQKHQQEVAEIKLQLEQTKNKLSEAQKTATQGSMQRQGEAQERLLIEKLQEKFPQDRFEQKRTGKEESDIKQVVIDNNGIECGIILYESKNTKVFNNAWLDKLKKDGFVANANELILITQTMPEYNKDFHRKDDIWICPLPALLIVTDTLRAGLISIYNSNLSQQNRKEKEALLYDYMTGNEFKYYIESIVNGIARIQRNYEKERMQMQKLWKQRDKEFESITTSVTSFFGAIKGIGGKSIQDIEELELAPEPDITIEEEEENQPNYLLDGDF